MDWLSSEDELRSCRLLEARRRAQSVTGDEGGGGTLID